MSLRVQRIDLASGRVANTRPTPTGGLALDAYMTRAGIFDYQQPDGSVRRELRHPDDVFEAESLASLAHAAVTIDHPSGGRKVTPENWRELSNGHVASSKREDDFVAGAIHVNDRKGIEAVKSGKAQELSCGYDCEVEKAEPGATYKGQAYDYRQKRIRYNHVAMGPRGWGRAGPDVQLHLDSGTAVSGAGGDAPYVSDVANESTTPAAAPPPAVTPPSAAAAASPPAAVTPPPATTTNTDAAVEGRLAALQAENLRLTTALQTREDADAVTRLDAAVAERMALIDRVRPHMPSGNDGQPAWKADGKANAAIVREVVEHLGEDAIKQRADSGKWTEAHYAAAFEVLITGAEDRLARRGHTLRALPGGAGPNARTDRRRDEDEEPDTDRDDIRDSRERMVDNQRNAWKDSKRRGDRRHIDENRAKRQAADKNRDARRAEGNR